jgi:DNA-binding phage protein
LEPLPRTLMTKQRQHKPYRDHEEAFIESLRKDPQFGAEYLNAVLEDGEFLVGQVLGTGGDAQVGDRFHAPVYEKREVDFIVLMRTIIYRSLHSQ